MTWDNTTNTSLQTLTEHDKADDAAGSQPVSLPPIGPPNPQRDRDRERGPAAESVVLPPVLGARSRQGSFGSQHSGSQPGSQQGSRASSRPSSRPQTPVTPGKQLTPSDLESASG